MNVLIVNTSERIGGAAVAAYRLKDSLIKSGINAKMLVRDKQTNSASTIALAGKWKQKANFIWERLYIWLKTWLPRKALFTIDVAVAGTDITSLKEFKEADIIHLHWINQGMLSLKDIQAILTSGKPVVWTMHDMWPCTGICHHARTCEGYHTECKRCPYLNSTKGADLSTVVFRKKQKLYANHHITFVACSDWLAKEAKKSRLLEGHTIKTIPNPIDSSVFFPRKKEDARKELGLPIDRKLILFCSVNLSDQRKGLIYMIECCRLIIESNPSAKDEIGILLVGNNSEILQEMLPFQIFPMGYVSNEEKLSRIYSAADTFVTPSLEENLPNTIAEAMSCGTPCVGFNTGGIPEMISHMQNGYVAQYRNSQDLAHGIECTLAHTEWREAAHDSAKENYGEERVAQEYMKAYEIH